MLDLRIRQQFARIGLEINNARYELKQSKPDIEVKQVPADLKLEKTLSGISIDYTPMLQSLGYGDIEFMARSFSEASRQEYLANLEKQVRIGNQMADVRKKMSIGDILFQSNMPPDRDLELVPVTPVDITFIPGTVRTKVQLGGVQLNVDYGKVSVENFVFPSVKIFMEQEPYLKIETVGKVFDQRK